MSAFDYSGTITDDLSKSFDKAHQSTASAPVTGGATSETSQATFGAASVLPDRSQTAGDAARPAITYLPDVTALPRPEELLSQPPYHLIVRALGDTRMDIQCSHGASLEVLAAYLKRWTRTNNNLSTKVCERQIRSL
jgi:hypothetical protein